MSEVTFQHATSYRTDGTQYYRKLDNRNAIVEQQYSTKVVREAPAGTLNRVQEVDSTAPNRNVAWESSDVIQVVPDVMAWQQASYEVPFSFTPEYRYQRKPQMWTAGLAVRLYATGTAASSTQFNTLNTGYEITVDVSKFLANAIKVTAVSQNSGLYSRAFQFVFVGTLVQWVKTALPVIKMSFSIAHNPGAPPNNAYDGVDYVMQFKLVAIENRFAIDTIDEPLRQVDQAEEACEEEPAPILRKRKKVSSLFKWLKRKV